MEDRVKQHLQSKLHSVVYCTEKIHTDKPLPLRTFSTLISFPNSHRSNPLTWSSTREVVLVIIRESVTGVRDYVDAARTSATVTFTLVSNDLSFVIELDFSNNQIRVTPSLCFLLG